MYALKTPVLSLETSNRLIGTVTVQHCTVKVTVLNYLDRAPMRSPLLKTLPRVYFRNLATWKRISSFLSKGYPFPHDPIWRIKTCSMLISVLVTVRDTMYFFSSRRTSVTRKKTPMTRMTLYLNSLRRPLLGLPSTTICDWQWERRLFSLRNVTRMNLRVCSLARHDGTYMTPTFYDIPITSDFVQYSIYPLERTMFSAHTPMRIRESKSDSCFP